LKKCLKPKSGFRLVLKCPWRKSCGLFAFSRFAPLFRTNRPIEEPLSSPLLLSAVSSLKVSHKTSKQVSHWPFILLYQGQTQLPWTRWQFLQVILLCGRLSHGIIARWMNNWSQGSFPSRLPSNIARTETRNNEKQPICFPSSRNNWMSVLKNWERAVHVCTLSDGNSGEETLTAQ